MGFNRTAFLLIGTIFMVTATAATAERPAQFIGVEGCRGCHASAAIGDQYGRWAASAHARAYRDLGTDRAREVAARLHIGIPQQDERCLRCHVTAFGAPAGRLSGTFRIEEGVQCESCHGAGERYASFSVMVDRVKAVASGLVIPGPEICRSCHNSQSPTFKEFRYDRDKARIAHPTPRGGR